MGEAPASFLGDPLPMPEVAFPTNVGKIRGADRVRESWRSVMELTTSSLLDAMEKGRVYCVDELAKHIGSSTIQVNEMLCTLVQDGFVCVSNNSQRCFYFERLSGIDGINIRCV